MWIIIYKVELKILVIMARIKIAVHLWKEETKQG
jgi:hypothetical protein